MIVALIIATVVLVGFVLWDYSSAGVFAAFTPSRRRESVPTQRPKIRLAKVWWYCWIAVAVAGILLALSKQASAQEAPVPYLGCHVFDAAGRVVQPGTMTDKQLMQALSCEKVAQDQAAWESRMAADMSATQTSMDRANASAQALVNVPPAAGYAGRIPTQLPGNTPTIVIQTQ